MSERWRLDGKRALVTGGTRGIGRAVAEELLGLGATVTIVARQRDDISDALHEWTRRQLPVRGVAADLAIPEVAGRIVAAAARQMGGIDLLINNVGTNVRKTSLDIDPVDYARIFAVNLSSAWEMCRAAHEALSQAQGVIINIGSVSGARYTGSGAPYAMSKAALDQMTRYLAVEWAPEGIRVNAVDPWYVHTPLAAPVLNDPDRRAQILARTPLNRIGEPEDVAAAVAFLCLPAARHITGQCLAVDGGFLASGL